MYLKYSLPSLVVFTCISVAQTTNALDADLKERAASEIRQPGKIKRTASDAQVTGTGMISLEDPRPTIVGRKWSYYVALAAQQFHPQGRASNDLTNSSFNLGTAGGALLPSLAIGFRAPLYSQDNWTLDWSLGGKVAYTSQKTSATFSTNYTHGDVRLNSALLSVTPGLSFTSQRVKWLTGVVGYDWGSLHYTQSSSDELANLSNQAGYMGWNVGADFNLTSSWSITTLFSRRHLIESNTTLALQNDNFELGTRILW